MSHCRWSDLDHGCDLYCYESEDGFVTHVASTRPVGTVPHVPVDWFRRDPEEMAAAMREQRRYLADCGHEAIGLPHDGASFVDADAAGMLARVAALGALGYRFPAHLETTLADEAEEAGTAREVARPG